MSLSVNTQLSKKKAFKYDKESSLYYIEIGFEELMALYRSRAINGEVKEEDSVPFSLDAMEVMVVGWKGVIEKTTKKPIKFDKKYIRALAPGGIIKFFKEVLTPMLVEWGLTGDKKADSTVEQLKN